MEHDSNNVEVEVKKPKRVLKFSDGTLEESSENEDDQVDSKQQQALAVVDPKTLSWVPWFGYMVGTAGSSTLTACDYIGESLASFFGITTPKYYLEIEEFKRIEEVKKREQELREGWVPLQSDIAVTQPITTDKIIAENKEV